MADTLSQPLTVFSRDLKYMLDARHAAAPLRRPAGRSALAALLVVTLAVAAWIGIRTPTPKPVEQPSSTPLSPGHQPEYTQVEQAVSKAGDTAHPLNASPLGGENGNDDSPAKRELEWRSHSVRRGDTLGKIFHRFSIDVGLASRIAADESGQVLKTLLPGRTMRLGFDKNGRLAVLRYELGRLEELVVDFESPDSFTVGKQSIPVETREHSASRIIGSSLFVTASEAGLADRLIMQLVSIFGWEIDFALDIRSGDRFSIIYEELLRNGESIGTGDIVAAEFVNQGKVYRAVRHIDDQGHKEYFDLQGKNLRGTFLKTPMRVTRITSGFSKRRYHPVLKKWRAHRGVDYGASTGTPVLATGDGRVELAGRKGGYGNTIILKHGGRYSTLYAHLSRFAKGVRRGAAVQQGDVIGYVGATGLVTGPHLHYEFRVDGQHRDPLTFETPKAEPIEARYRKEFLAMAQERIDEIAEIRAEQVASR